MRQPPRLKASRSAVLSRASQEAVLRQPWRRLKRRRKQWLCCASILNKSSRADRRFSARSTGRTDNLSKSPILIASSSTPDQVSALQSRHGRDVAGHAIEQAMADISEGLMSLNVRRLIVAGGERPVQWWIGSLFQRSSSEPRDRHGGAGTANDWRKARRHDHGVEVWKLWRSGLLQRRGAFGVVGQERDFCSS